MSAANRAAIYTRVSTQGQSDDGTSLETQEEHCRRYCDEHGYVVDRVYREVWTGIELHERPVLEQLVDSLAARRVGVVVAYAIDRLSRDPEHLIVFLDKCERVGATVEFVTEQLDDTLEGKLIRFVRGYAAKVEHQKIKERTRRGMRARVQNGKPWPGPSSLYGYDWADQEKARYQVNDGEAAVVRRVFSEYSQGKSIRQIASGLNDDHILSASGSVWHPATVHRVLSHPGYAGLCYGWRYGFKAGKLRGVRPESEWIELPQGTVPAIVDIDDWEAAQTRLAVNKQQAVRNNKHPEDFLLRGGIAVCGVCGSNMYALGIGNGKYRYVCGSKRSVTHDCPSKPTIMTDILDNAVWSMLAPFFSDTERMLQTGADDSPSTAELQAMEGRLSRIAKKQERLVRELARFEDDTTLNLIRSELASLANQAKRLEQERSRLEQEQSADDITIDTLRAELATIAERVKNADYHTKRLYLTNGNVRVEVFPSGSPHRFLVTSRFKLKEFVSLCRMRCG